MSLGKIALEKRPFVVVIREEIEVLLANDSGTQAAAKCITLNTYGMNIEMLMKGLANMKELRFLHVDTPYVLYVSRGQVSSWNFDEYRLHLPNALRFLRWANYPSSSSPKTFEAKNLVGFEMYQGGMVKLWQDGEEKPFLKLRFLKITYSHLLRTLYLNAAPNLETLFLELCNSLEEVHFQVTPNLKELRIHHCLGLEKLHLPAESPKLTSLYLFNLKKLRTLHLGITPNLKELRIHHCLGSEKLHMPAESQKLINLSDCTDMVEVRLPAECPNLESLNLRYCGRFESFKFEKKLDSTEVVSLSELHLSAKAYDADDTNDADDTGICDPGNIWPEFKFSCDYKEDPASSFGNLERLISLGFGSRINADSFSDIICGLHCLRKLTLEGGIPEAPKNLDRLDSLEELSMRSTDIKTLPDSICMLKHLKYLKLESCLLLEKLPVDIGRLECLESLILSECTKLTSFHLGITPKLETLSLNDCCNLVELHLPFSCLKLKNLSLNGSKLRNLNLGMTPDLETLRILECTDMVELRMPAECPKLVNLYLSNIAKLTTLHLGITPNLEQLRLDNCANMVELHMPAECPKLVNLYLSNIAKLTTLHLGITPNLEQLRLDNCADMVELHMPAECPKLVNLDLYYLKLTTLHLGITPNLEQLRLDNCADMVELHMPAECPKLVNLDLCYLKLTTLHLGITPNLETLRLGMCTDMVELHITAECRKLVTLQLNNNAKLRTLDLGLTPNIESLILYYCSDLEEFNAPAECLKKLLDLDMSHCGRFESFEFDKELDSPEGVSLSELHLIADDTYDADDTGICDPGNTWPEFQFSCYYKEGPASPFGNLERLISLGFGARINIDSFSDIICGLQCLRKLTLEGGIREAPRNLDRLDCLEELIFSSTKIINLPDSICKMKHLKSLEFKSCLLLKKLPDNLGRIESLEMLIITNCNRLPDIPNNMGKIKCVISPKVYKRYTHGKFKQRPINDAVDRPTRANT